MRFDGHPPRDGGTTAEAAARFLPWCGFAAGAILVLWLGIRVPLERVELRPLPDLPFSDTDKGGNSLLSYRADAGGARISWELRDGNPYPYCGALWHLRSGDTLLDLSDFEGLEVAWRSAKGFPVRWTLETLGPEASIPGIAIPVRLVQSETRPPRDWAKQTIPQEAFRIPLWWFQNNHRMADSLRCLGRTSNLTFSSGESAPHGIADTVHLRSIALLRRGRRRPAFLLALIPLGLLGTALFRRRPKVPPSLPLPPRPLELPPTAAQKVVAFLAENYARPELDLALAARETSLSEAAVSAGVKEATGEGFRQHLGRLRLTEAARLVRTTRLQVTEIAFRVGYGNVSHFNRQFRELWGCSPSEMRQGGAG